jgi:hypothetical protein
MPARLNWESERACDRSLTAVVEPEETLVHDARVGVTPAQMVEQKLMASLKNSHSGAFTRSSELIDVERKQKALFQMADAIHEGRQRTLAGRRIDDSTARRKLVPFLQMAKAPMPQAALAVIPCP